MAPSTWVVFMAFPVVFTFVLGVAHRVPPAPKAMEEAADLSSGEAGGAEIVGGDTGGLGMSFGMGDEIWDGTGSEPEHGDSHRSTRMIFSGSSSFGSVVGIGKTGHGCGAGARDIGQGFPEFGSTDLEWANRPLYCVPLECQGLPECSAAFVMNFGLIQASPPMGSGGHGNTADGCDKESHKVGKVAEGPSPAHNATASESG